MTQYSMHGYRLATATTDIISGAGALDVALRAGAYTPLKPVASFANALIADVIRDNERSRIVRKITNDIAF